MRVPDFDGDVIEEPINITNSPGYIEEDADWSPDGEKIVFTRHDVRDNPLVVPFNYETGEICVLDLETPDAEPQCLLGLLTNSEDERGPAWSPDGTKIAFMCRNPSNSIFEICVINPDGTDQMQLTPHSPSTQGANASAIWGQLWVGGGGRQ